MSRPTVIKWRDRFTSLGIAGLDDEPRSGRPKVVDDAAIIATTLDPPPERLGVTHWSTRLLAKELGIGDATVARAWRRYHVQPWRQGTFKFSTDPELEAKVRDVVGLYLDPPEQRRSSCAWTRRARSRPWTAPQPILPLRPGLPEKATHDYKRNGITNLFAALEVATGQVTDRCYERHGKAEFLDFLKRVAKAYPGSGAARDPRQLPHPQARRHRGLAREASPGDAALHPDVRVVAQPRRGVLRHHHPPSHPAWLVR